MQILKSSKERQGDRYNRYIPVNEQKDVDIDNLAARAKANREAANSHSFKEWKDSDGSVFEKYSELLDYQTDKFIKIYPPNFAMDFRPELVFVKEGKISWNREALRLLMADNSEWYRFRNALDIHILKWDGYDFDNEFAKGKDRVEALRSAQYRMITAINSSIEGKNNAEN